MLITEAYINEQIVSLKKQAEQLLANYNATQGGLQVYEQQLAYLKLPEGVPHEGS